MGGSELRWPVFWSCAAGVLAIIVLRKHKRSKEGREYAGEGEDGTAQS